jgi:hypothetical protein
MPTDASTNRIAGLEALLESQGGKGPAPVDKWDPPYCGDIGMAIRSDGVWLYQGSPIGRMPLVKLFAGVLRKDADGRHYLVTPAGRSMCGSGGRALPGGGDGGAGQRARAGAGVSHQRRRRIVEAGAEHPAALSSEPGSGGLKPYLLVRGRLEELVTRALYTTSSSWRSTMATAWASGAAGRSLRCAHSNPHRQRSSAGRW